MKKNWYAVKTLYFQEAKGSAKNKDNNYLKSSVTLEERVVLFFTESFKKAVKLAEKEAHKYCKKTYKNSYGEKIHTNYTGFYDAVQFSNEPEHGMEVFAIMDLYKSKAEMKKALKYKAGVFHGLVNSSLKRRFEIEA